MAQAPEPPEAPQPDAVGFVQPRPKKRSGGGGSGTSYDTLKTRRAEVLVELEGRADVAEARAEAAESALRGAEARAEAAESALRAAEVRAKAAESALRGAEAAECAALAETAERAEGCREFIRTAAIQGCRDAEDLRDAERDLRRLRQQICQGCRLRLL